MLKVPSRTDLPSIIEDLQRKGMTFDLIFEPYYLRDATDYQLDGQFCQAKFLTIGMSDISGVRPID
jgi:hypothetical protein